MYVEDGREPAIAEGAGTIGVELLAAGPFDTIVVPVGDGALIAGVACWIKHHAAGNSHGWRVRQRRAVHGHELASR